MTTPYSTIMNNVNVILVDSSTITPANPYIVYISSVSIPGRVATVRDATGYLSSPNQIIVSTLKDVLINPNISTFTITQPYGYISLSSRDTHTWNIINTFAFPDPQGTANVSSLHVNDGINANSLYATVYISTPYINTYSISSFNLVASNAISTNLLEANSISTNYLRSFGPIKSDRLRVSTISSYYTYANYISSGFISSGTITTDFLSAGLLLGSSLSTTSIAANIVAANSISTGLLTAPSISSASIAASLISSGLFIGTSVSTLALATSTVVANSISTGVLIVPSISSVNIAASLISSGLFIGPSVSTLALATSSLVGNTISTGILNVASISSGSISASNISSGLFIGSSVSTNAIAASVVAANTISTGILNVASISSVNIYASNISSSVFVGSSLVTNNILANNISSIAEKTSSLTTSSIILQSGSGIGYITASSDGTNILYNAKPIGTWISTATGDLFMSTYTIRTSTLVTSSISLRTGVSTGVLSISANGSNLLLNSAPLANGWVGTATTNLNMNIFSITTATNIQARSALQISEQVYGTTASITYANPTLTNPIVTINKSLSIAGYNLLNVSTLSLQGTGTSNGLLQLTGDAQTLKLNGSNVGGWIGNATTGLNMNGNSISNVSTLVIKSGIGNGTLQTSSDGLTLYFNSNAIGGGGAGWVGTAASDLNMNNYNILNTRSISTISLSTNTLQANYIVASSVSSISISTNILQANSIVAPSVSSINISTNILKGNYIVAPSFSTINISTNNILANSMSTLNISTNKLQATSLLVNSISTVNLLTNSISSIYANTSSLATSSIIFQNGPTLAYLVATSDGQTLKLNGSNVGGWISVASSDLNMNQHTISNVNTIDINTAGTAGALTVTADGQTLKLNGSNVGGWVHTATTNLDMGGYTISNITTNYSNVYSNINSINSILGSAPQPFTNALYNRTLVNPTSVSITTSSESNYLYKTSERNQLLWNINVCMTGQVSTSSTFSAYFELSTSNSLPLSISRLSKPFRITPILNDLGTYDVALSFNDTVNFTNYENNYGDYPIPIHLNMNICPNKYASSYLSNWAFANQYSPNLLSDWSVANTSIDQSLTTWNYVSITRGLTYYGIAGDGNNNWLAVGNGDNTNYETLILQSTDNGATWSEVGSIMQADSLCVAYANNTWVVGGEGSSGFHCIITSSDGSSWTSSDLNGVLITGIVYAGVWVAVGGANRPYYSSDPTSWTNVSLGDSFRSGNAVAYGNGIFTAVGSGGSYEGASILTSSDGITWTSAGVTTNNVNCVAYGNGRWFAYSDDDALLYYSDNNWSSFSSYSPHSGLTSITVVGTIVYAIGNDGYPYYSLDNGANWNIVAGTHLSSSRPSAIASVNGKFIAVGTQVTPGFGDTIHYSPIISSSFSDIEFAYGYGVAYTSYGTGSFMAVGAPQGTNTSILVSSNGINWSNVGGSLQSISYCVTNGYRSDWMIGGDTTPIIYTANNGSTYSIPSGVNQTVSVGLAYNSDLEIYVSVSSNDADFPAVIQYGDNAYMSNASGSIFQHGNAVAYGGSIFTAVGYSSFGNRSIIKSTDGATWTSADLSGEINATCVAYWRGQWFAYGSSSGYLYYSTDNWATISSNNSPLAPFVSMCINDVYIFALDTNGHIEYSSDNGASWSYVSGTQFNYNSGSIIFGGDKIVAVGRSGNYPNFSSNILYTTATTIGMGIGYAVISANNTWYATGSAGPLGYTSQILKSYNGNNWFPIGDSNLGTGRAVAYGNGVLMVGGEFVNDRIMYSTDNGATFVSANTGRDTCVGLAYGNGTWLAVYAGPGMEYSIDNGAGWSFVYGDAFDNGYGVAYGNGVWVAVGDNGDSHLNNSILISINGANWTTMNITGNIVNCVAYGNRRWLAYSSGDGLLYYSDTPLFAWYSYTGTPNFNSLVYGDRWFGTAADGIIYYSIDNGATWTTVPGNSFSSGQGNGIAYNNLQLVAVGANGTDPNILYSLYNTSNITNTFINTNIQSNWNFSPLLFSYLKRVNVAYGNNTWMVVGPQFGGITSITMSVDNGITWYFIPAVSSDINALAYGNGTWVFGDLSGNIRYSYDNANTFTSATGSFANNCYDIAFGNNMFVAVGDNGGSYSIMYSTNGISWTHILGFSTNGNAIAYANGRFVAVGNDITNGVYTSTDGINWTGINITISGICVCYANGRWFVYSADGLLYYSDDDTNTWTSVSGVPDFTDLTAGDTLVGTVHRGGIAYSYDNGITWSSVFGNPLDGNAIAYANGTYVAVGDSICSATDMNILSYTLQPAAIQPSLAPV